MFNLGQTYSKWNLRTNFTFAISVHIYAVSNKKGGVADCGISLQRHISYDKVNANKTLKQRLVYFTILRI